MEEITLENREKVSELLTRSNYDAWSSELSDFIKEYIQKLVQDILTYVNSEISVGDIELVEEFHANKELSQEITGVPAAYSAMDAEEDVLLSFAADYAKFEITEYDVLAKESLLDFLNLHNGLFVVQLSKLNICELSLSVPKQNGAFLMTSPATGKITVIPVTFSYGTIRFLLCELDNRN